MRTLMMPGMRASIGQQTTTAPPGTVQTPATASVPAAAPEPKPAFIDSALMSFGVDLVGVVGTGMLAYAGKATKRPTMTLIFGILSGAMGLKGLVDLAYVRER